MFSHRGYSSLSRQFKKSIPTIQKYIDEFNTPHRFGSDNRWVKNVSAVVIIDTVYLSGKSFGVMIARDAHKKKTIDRIYITTETIGHFRSLVERVQKKGVTIKALVLDGRPGMLASYPNIPTQMCHFHQIQIITRYVTTRPKLEAGKQLRRIVLLLPTIEKRLFLKLLDQWHEIWETFIKEKTVNPETGRWEYTHRRIRSAYYSLRHNIPYLFTYQQKRIKHLSIPNTTNGLDGSFGHLKDALRVHRGLRRKRKIRLIESLIWR